MYRFDSIEDFEKTYDEAYINALERDLLDEYDALALFAIRMLIARKIGEIKGILEAANKTFETKEMIDEVTKCTGELEGRCEIITKRMEELKLM